mmetsp:Transcript_27226/g.37384  ORF Transcript_27226/g.37384 Transcript_27226/m.37384 type:complete len:215 (-) Transcript_27226:1079-1723(-)
MAVHEIDTKIHTSTTLCFPDSSSMCTNERLVLHVLRYANSVPLLEYEDDSLSCIITQAVRSLDWSNYGYKLHHLLNQTDRDTIEANGNLHHQRVLGSAVWELRNVRDEEVVADNDGQSSPSVGMKRRISNTSEKYQDDGEIDDNYCDENEELDDNAEPLIRKTGHDTSNSIAALIITVDIIGPKSIIHSFNCPSTILSSFSTFIPTQLQLLMPI